MLRDYKKDLNETKLNLDDDFIKFIRFAQWRIERTGEGIIGFITNNTYLDGLTHRRMRECLLTTFNEIYVLNLHGSSKKQEVAPDGSKDENVFDITVGVSIVFFVKLPRAKGCRLFHANLWGGREAKYKAPSETDASVTPWSELKPARRTFTSSRGISSKKLNTGGDGACAKPLSSPATPLRRNGTGFRFISQRRASEGRSKISGNSTRPLSARSLTWSKTAETGK